MAKTSTAAVDDAEQYAGFPDELIVRELKTAGRILVTTLLDHRRVSKAALSDL